jgi:hypothetical protein
MTAPPQAPPTEQVYGIAKKISLELEHFPLHTHAAIINVVNTMCQHRKLVLETEMQQKQVDAQEAAMADARKAHAEAAVKREDAIAAQIKASRAADAEAKAPRLSIVLDKPKPGEPSDADLEAVEREREIAMQTALAL